MLNIISRRSFLERAALGGTALGLTSMLHAPMFIKRALAEGTIGTNGKKVLFIFLRGANDGLNSVIPVMDPSYYSQRTLINIPKDGGLDSYYNNPNGATNGYGTVTKNSRTINKMFDPTDLSAIAGAPRGTGDAVFSYANAIPGGNGFAGLHPSHKFLAPLFNTGDLAVIHRVGYPKQSRSHFDSQIYWENGNPGMNNLKEGIFYRTMLESGLTTAQTLTGVSFQTSLPLILRGSEAAMTNLSDPTRFSLFGVPDTSMPRLFNTNGVAAANAFPFPAMGDNRSDLKLQSANLTGTLQTFSNIDFTDAGNAYYDSGPTDRDTDWAAATRSAYNANGSAATPVPAKISGLSTS